MSIPIRHLIKIIIIALLLILAGCVQTTTQLTSENGIKNSVSFFPSELPNSPAVMILPGRGSKPAPYTSLAKKMNESGISVILVSYNCLGDTKWSKKVKEKRGGTEDIVANEVTAALNFLNSQPTVDKNRIGVLGGSMGTYVGFQAMAKFPELKSLAMLSPINATEGTFETNPETKKLVEAFGNRHLLLVGSENDRHSPEFPTAVEKSEYLSSIMPNAKIEKKYYPGNSHSYDMLTYHKDLNELFVQWFAKTL